MIEVAQVGGWWAYLTRHSVELTFKASASATAPLRPMPLSNKLNITPMVKRESVITTNDSVPQVSNSGIPHHSVCQRDRSIRTERAAFDSAQYNHTHYYTQSMTPCAVMQLA